MNLENAKRALEMLIKSKVPIMLKGAPGIGKSTVVKDYAEKHDDFELIDYRLSQIDSLEVKGIAVPVKKTETIKWFTPDNIPLENNPKFENDSKGILFLDEANLAKKDVLNAIFELIHDRTMNGVKLIDGWSIVLAGNMGYEDGNRVEQFSTALLDRMVVIDIEFDVYVWLDWAKNNIIPQLYQFIKSNPRFVDYEIDSITKQKVTGRTWERLSKIITCNDIENIVEIVELLGLSIIKDVYPHLLKFIKAGSISAKNIFNDYPKYKSELIKYDRSQLLQIKKSLIYAIINENIKITTAQLKNFVRFCEERLYEDTFVSLIIQLLRHKNPKGEDFVNKLIKYNKKYEKVLENALRQSFSG